MPDPVIRTTPPRTMRPKAKTAPVQASRRRSRLRSFCFSGIGTLGWRPWAISVCVIYLAMLPERDAWGERLPRHLGLWSAVAVLIGSTIGSGIFRVPAGVAARLQDPGPVLLAWVIGGV